jgi:hypothetical protein
MFGGFILALFLSLWAPTTPIEKTFDLQNLADNTVTEGNFFLGSGSIEGVPTYSYYKKTAPNTFEREDIDAEDAKIHYTEGQPRIIRTCNVSDKSWGLWYFNPTHDDCYTKEYHIYIPNGSIKPLYELDAE